MKDKIRTLVVGGKILALPGGILTIGQQGILTILDGVAQLGKHLVGIGQAIYGGIHLFLIILIQNLKEQIQNAKGANKQQQHGFQGLCVFFHGFMSFSYKRVLFIIL